MIILVRITPEIHPTGKGENEELRELAINYCRIATGPVLAAKIRTVWSVTKGCSAYEV
jgi:hypothetical protein